MILPKPGIYAATAYHDENDNGKFDKNRAGLPVEGFGVSNNPTTLLPTSHDQAAFAVSHGRTRVNIEISHRYADRRVGHPTIYLHAVLVS